MTDDVVSQIRRDETHPQPRLATLDHFGRHPIRQGQQVADTS